MFVLAGLLLCLFASVHSTNYQTIQPVRFLLFSVQESGTHFVRNVFLSLPKMYFWNELCASSSEAPDVCLDKISLALALPTVTTPPSDEVIQNMMTSPSKKDVYLNGETPRCSGKGGLTQFQCFYYYMNRANAISCILHQNQGWGKNEFMQRFIQLHHKNKELYGIDIRVLFLHRTNFIAHSIAAPNTNLRSHRDVTKTKYTIVLKNVYRTHYASQKVYFDAINVSRMNNISSVYVTYERLNSNSSTFESLLLALHININSTILHVSNTTKHHSNHTYEYIHNIREVIVKLNSSSNPYVNSFTKLDVCMLYDNCVLQPPSFCEYIPCFV